MCKELELLEAISRGIDPRDGTMLDTPRDPGLDKVRLQYLSRLKQMQRQKKKKPRAVGQNNQNDEKPPMQGKPWLAEDDRNLMACWGGDEKPTVADVAKMFGRGEGSIVARLVHVGLYGSRDDAKTANALRVKAKAE